MYHVKEKILDKILTIPSPNIMNERELVMIPRKEYEFLLHVATKVNQYNLIPSVRLSASQKKTITKSEEEFKKGEYFTLKELKNELENSHSKISH